MLKILNHDMFNSKKLKKLLGFASSLCFLGTLELVVLNENGMVSAFY